MFILVAELRTLAFILRGEPLEGSKHRSGSVTWAVTYRKHLEVPEEGEPTGFTGGSDVSSKVPPFIQQSMESPFTAKV